MYCVLIKRGKEGKLMCIQGSEDVICEKEMKCIS